MVNLTNAYMYCNNKPYIIDQYNYIPRKAYNNKKRNVKRCQDWTGKAPKSVETRNSASA